mgnify:CR=1 FL=1
MEPMTMMLLASVGTTLFSSVMGGIAGADKAKQEKAQHAYQEYKNKLQNQRQNRQISKENALKWENNKKIAETAAQRRVEEEIFIEKNYNNATGQFSRNVKAANDGLITSLNSKNIRGGTAKALLRQTIAGAEKASVSMRVAKENQVVSAERRQEAALGKRDFGFRSGIPYMPGADFTPSPASVMGNALLQGAVGATFAGLGAYGQASYLDGLNSGVKVNAGGGGATGTGGATAP